MGPCICFSGVHKFEARYDTHDYNGTIAKLEIRGEPLSKVIEATKGFTYVRDVCVKCGETIERETPNGE